MSEAARQVGLQPQAGSKIIMRVPRRLVVPDKDENRKAMLERLQRYRMDVTWAEQLDPIGAAHARVRIEEREAKLPGLDAPTKVSGADGVLLEVLDSLLCLLDLFGPAAPGPKLDLGAGPRATLSRSAWPADTYRDSDGTRSAIFCCEASQVLPFEALERDTESLKPLTAGFFPYKFGTDYASAKPLRV